MRLWGLTFQKGGRRAPVAGRPRPSPAQPDLVELEVAAIRMNNRVEAADRGLRADRTVAESEDYVVNLVVNPLLHLLVDVGPRGGVDGHARLLQEIVELRVLDLAIVERAGGVPAAVVEEIRLPQREEVHHRDLEVLFDPDLAQPSSPGQLLDLHVDAGFLEPLEHDLR